VDDWKSKSKTVVTIIARMRASEHAKLSGNDKHNWVGIYFSKHHLKMMRSVNPNVIRASKALPRKLHFVRGNSKGLQGRVLRSNLLLQVFGCTGGHKGCSTIILVNYPNYLTNWTT